MVRIAGCILWLLLLPISLRAEGQSWRGRVTDAQTGEPVAEAIVVATNASQQIVAYATASASGSFALVTDEQVSALRFSMMGYATRLLERCPPGEHLEVALTPRPTPIREVVVQAPRISLRGDTLSYDVAGFAQAQDRTIGDVLRKMPGVEVDRSGQIRYNGEPINKFYIEGVDMLDSKYSLATNNIARSDVASVEILEDHQPVKALRDLQPSDRAAINLRLKKEARSRWRGSVRAAAGGAPLLWSGELFGMRIAAVHQQMLSAKSDNTGRDPAADLTDHATLDLTEAPEPYRLPRLLETGVAAAPLGERRTRFNRSHTASTTDAWKLANDYQLNTQFSYLYDRLSSDHAARSVWYTADGELTATERERARQRRQEAAARITLTANTQRFFLKERLTARLQWDESLADISGSYPNRQGARLAAHGVANDLQLMRRVGQRMAHFTSRVQYDAAPDELTIERAEGRSEGQTIRSHAFYTDNRMSWGTGVGRWRFTFKGGARLLARRFETAMRGMETIADSLNDAALGSVQLYGSGDVAYRSAAWLVELGAAGGWEHAWYRDRIEGRSRPGSAFLPQLSLRVKWQATPRLSLTAAARSQRALPDEAMRSEGAVLRNYRYIVRGAVEYARTRSRSLSAAARYRNPVSSLFMHLAASCTWSRLPLTAARRFEGEYIVDSYLHRESSPRSWLLKGGISKGIDALHGQVALDAVYSRSLHEAVQQGVPLRYTSASFTLAPRLDIRMAAWCNAAYRLDYRRSTLRPEGAARSLHGNLSQTLSLTVLPHKKLLVTLSGEHYLTRVAPGRDKELLLADCRIAWSIGGNWEVWFEATNLFDCRSYAYTLFDGLNSVWSSYAIRGRNLMAGLYVRF